MSGKLTASCTFFTISGSSVAVSSAVASPVAIEITFLAILRPVFVHGVV